jgi:hypothetical protein
MTRTRAISLAVIALVLIAGLAWLAGVRAGRHLEPAAIARLPSGLSAEDQRMAKRLWGDPVFYENGVGVAVQRGLGNTLERVSLATTGATMMFEYEPRGPYGLPMSTYSAGPDVAHSVFWVDLNADGIFDRRGAFEGSRVEIRIGEDLWIRCTGKTETDNPASPMRTEKGVFRFDATEGVWKAEDLAKP